MKKIRDFRCKNLDCLHTQEVWVEDDIKELVCPECMGTMNRMVSSPKVKGNTLGKSASFSSKRY